MSSHPDVRRLRLGLLVSVLLLGLGACGDGDDPAGSELPTLYDIARDDARLGVLAEAVDSAGLDGILAEDGPFTVFAPVDSAFESLGAGGTSDLLLPENRALLTAALTYHVVAGEIVAADLRDGQVIRTLAEETLEVDVSGDAVRLVDAAGSVIGLVDTDLRASNGVVHLIEGVLMRPLDLVETAAINGLGTLLMLLEEAGLTETLRGEGPFTVFAPTDEAFGGITPPTGADLETLLLGHLVEEELFAADFFDGQVLATISTGTVTVGVDGGTGGVTLTHAGGNTVEVTEPDLRASNGVIHIIDGVLQPGG